VNKSICSECNKWRSQFPTCTKKCKKLEEVQTEDDLRRSTIAGYLGNKNFHEMVEHQMIVYKTL
jgi:hypothetical protein